MHLSEARRILPRVASAVLVSAAVGVLSVPAAQSASPAAPSRATARTLPADLYRGQQWTLNALHIPRAWKYSRGDGVTVAVLDTGVDGRQPDLAGRVVDGPDFTGHTRKPGNKYWGRHGTEMASLIAGHGHGTGGTAGVMGVAPDAKILSIRVTWELDDPMRTDHTQVDHARDAVANGIRYAADHGAQIISMSLGGGNLFYNGNASEEAAIKYALSKGAILVASAGNDGNAANRRNYPAAYPGVIAVGAVDRTFKAARFTNRHTYISVAAPGVEIVSADASGHGYILGTGTSSSAAFVAGVGALVRARYPSLTPEEVKQALEEGATHRPPDGRSPEIGTGVVDAYGALRTAARINKAEHGGAAVDQPQQTTRPSVPHGRSSPDLLLIAVLSGGGTLILLSLILGWRTRRRRAAAEAEDEFEEPAEVPVPAARTAASRSEPTAWDRRSASETSMPRRSPSSDTSSGRSPWERRPPEAQDDDLWNLGSRGPSPSATGAWDRRRLPSAPAESSSWDRPADPAEPPSTAGRHRSEPASWGAGDDGSTSEASLAGFSGSAWDRSAAEPFGGGQGSSDPRDPTPGPGWEGKAPDPSRWGEPPAEASRWDESPAEASRWSEPAAEASRWDDRPAEASRWSEPLGEAPRWDEAPADPSRWGEPPAEASRWDEPAGEAPRWDDPPSKASRWDEPPGEAPRWDEAPRRDEPSGEAPLFPAADKAFPAEAPSSSGSVWRDPQAEPHAGSGSGTRSLFDAIEPFQTSPYEASPSQTNPYEASPYGARPDEEGAYEAPERREDTYLPPEASDPLTTLPNAGGLNAPRTPAPRDFRVAGGNEPDPLTDDRIDSSDDVGTPLADESWESIRRGFDRLKDASNWESLAKGDFQDPGDLPGAYDETAAMPIVDPDEDDGRSGDGQGGGGGQGRRDGER